MQPFLPLQITESNLLAFASLESKSFCKALGCYHLTHTQSFSSSIKDKIHDSLGLILTAITDRGRCVRLIMRQQ